MSDQVAQGILKLSHARAWRTYQGGKLLETFLGLPEPQDSHFPELWIASTVAARNAGREDILDEGLSYVEAGAASRSVSLKSLIEADPTRLLGAEHVRKFGTSPGVLIKLIDSSERLSIQVHPNKTQAKALFGSDYGKTECWHILGGRSIQGEKPHIYFGFKEGITRELWQAVFASQDIPAMLNLLHRFDVEPGETYLIEGGIPHAIGAGCYLIEIQEPTDLTIRTERVTATGETIADKMCHQRLGFEKMFDCFTYEGLSREETIRRWCLEPTVTNEPEAQQKRLVSYEDTTCFQMTEWLVCGEKHLETDSRFVALVIMEGSGEIHWDAHKLPVKQGDLFFVPAHLATYTVQQSGTQPLRFFTCVGPQIG